MSSNMPFTSYLTIQIQVLGKKSGFSIKNHYTLIDLKYLPDVLKLGKLCIIEPKKKVYYIGYKKKKTGKSYMLHNFIWVLSEQRGHINNDDDDSDEGEPDIHECEICKQYTNVHRVFDEDVNKRIKDTEYENTYKETQIFAKTCPKCKKICVEILDVKNLKGIYGNKVPIPKDLMDKIRIEIQKTELIIKVLAMNDNILEKLSSIGLLNFNGDKHEYLIKEILKEGNPKDNINLSRIF